MVMSSDSSQPTPAGSAMSQAAVSVRGLTVDFVLDDRVVHAVREIELNVPKGRILGIVGESGSGKSTLAFAMVNQVLKPGVIRQGAVHYAGFGNLLQKTDEEQRVFRWRHVSVVFQAAQNTLNPLLRIDGQVRHLALDHGFDDSSDVVQRGRDLFTLMHLDAERVMRSYPHELSGGMRQRVGVAFALLLSPEVMILDEPTTALDVLSQEAVVEIVRAINRDLGVTIVFITHDLSVVAELADHVAVMYAGRIVEQGGVNEVFAEPQHPYTRGLVRAIPPLFGDLSTVRPMPGQPPDPAALPRGCPFHVRCEHRLGICDQEEPGNRTLGDGRLVACHLFPAGGTPGGGGDSND